MFQTKPSSQQQRRPRRLPTGTMVSYAEVKSYLSKREIPQLFESLMAGLMYHRPENHIGYLQTCLDEVKSGGEGKVHWNTFVNTKKRKSKEILPPLTPKKQASYSSSLSDNSRQSTPLPPISAKTRTRTSHEDLRNTYILYHNPPPVLAKPKVPVVSVLGGLGSNIDELCERVVGRLRGVVHISTCSMLKTRMTIEGFYRITSVPACAVVDSVLQAMSMVQSANGLIVAGFPRNRGDIEEYRSRRVRMDGVVLVDFEEEALRRFLESEVTSGALRLGDVETELERYKQDIISVAEYYDEKELLTVVMGDQDMEEIIDDLVLAVDKVIETRKNVNEEDSLVENKKSHDGPCKTLIASPESINRPSTVEIRDATEEDIKSLEETSSLSVKSDEKDINNESAPVDVNKNEEDNVVNASSAQNEENFLEDDNAEEVPLSLRHEPEPDDVPQNAYQTDLQESKADDISDNVMSANEPHMDYKDASSEDNDKENRLEANKSDKTDPQSLKLEEPKKEFLEETTKESVEIASSNVALFFAFENIDVDYEKIKNLVVNEMGMCFIDFQELVRNDGSQDDKFDTDEALKLLQAVLQHDPVSYSNGFFISKFPFSLMSDHRITELLKLGEVNFVCKVRENKSQSDSKNEDEETLFHSNLSGKVRIIFITESNIIEELKLALQQVVSSIELHESSVIGSPKEDEKITSEDQSAEQEDDDEGVNILPNEMELESKISVQPESDGPNVEVNLNKDLQVLQVKSDVDELNQVLPDGDDLTKDDKNSRDDNEDSTSRDVDDLISDDTLEEGLKPADSLLSEADKIPDENVAESDAPSLASTAESILEDTQRENDQQKQEDIDQDASEAAAQDEEKPESERIYDEPPSSRQGKLLRQGTFSADADEDEKVEDDQSKIEFNSNDNFESKEGGSDAEEHQNDDRTESSVPEAENNEDIAEENGSECIVTASDPESQINEVDHQESEEIKHPSDKSSDKPEKVENAIDDITDFASTVVKYVETVKKLESVCDESVNDTESSSAECKDGKPGSEESEEKEAAPKNSDEKDDAESKVETVSGEATDFASTVIKYVETVKKSESLSEVSEQDVKCISNENNVEIPKSENEEIEEKEAADKSDNINSEELKNIEYTIKDITDFASTVVKYVETMKQPSSSSEKSEEENMNDNDEDLSQKHSADLNVTNGLPKIDETISESQVPETTIEEEVKVVNIEILEIVREKSPVIPMETIDEELGEHDQVMDQNENTTIETDENRNAESDEHSIKSTEGHEEESSFKKNPDDENSEEKAESTRLSETDGEVKQDTEICENENNHVVEEREESTIDDNNEEQNASEIGSDSVLIGESSKSEPESTEQNAENEDNSNIEEPQNDDVNEDDPSNQDVINDDAKSDQEMPLENEPETNEDNKDEEKESCQKVPYVENDESETKTENDQSELEPKQEHLEDTEQDTLKSESKNEENDSTENDLNIPSAKKPNEEPEDENPKKETTVTEVNLDETEDQNHSNKLEDESKVTTDEENCNVSVNESQILAEEIVHKIVDNDSDSNDENVNHSITIETQAEVHASDSVSPLVTADIGGEKLPEESSEAASEKSAMEESKRDHGEEEEISVLEGSNIEEKNPEEESEKCVIEGSMSEEKNSEVCPAVEEVPPNEDVREGNISENTDLSESLIIKEIDESLGSERYSAKIQERNGSGILGDREDDQHEPEEPQERSSSSSRGEL